MPKESSLVLMSCLFSSVELPKRTNRASTFMHRHKNTQLERLEHVAPGPNEGVNVLVRDDHAAEVKGLEAVEGVDEAADPRAGIAAPVLGDQVEHGSAGLALELEGLEVEEPAEEPVGGGGVADGDGDVLPREGVDAVPLLAHQRDGLPIAGVVDNYNKNKRDKRSKPPEKERIN
ncbi:hypothetical protein C4D60_Mb05t30640 [Musa balbisiana]|uniref:Uncharacterized protein n=1 Tax=Musa balbisiana TaxID=52838 RepID=A0A4S8JZZ5_MUSBA|nr:hypothetical protein C4D60_Mb05t30640 [Musa balbisiana]